MKKYNITKHQLREFCFFIRDNNIKHNFKAVYFDVIYFTNSDNTSLRWHVNTLNDEEVITLCKMLSSLFNIELNYVGEDK